MLAPREGLRTKCACIPDVSHVILLSALVPSNRSQVITSIQYTRLIHVGCPRTPENQLTCLCHGPDKNLTLGVNVRAESGQF